MSVELATSLVSFVTLYLLIGLVFSLVFVFFGVARIDSEARGMRFFVRLFILPGSILLWPLMAVKWLMKSQPPIS